MASLAASQWFGAALSAGGTVVSAGSQIAAGNAARRGGEFQAAQANQAAGQAEAASQRTAADEERRSRLLQSRALAVAAASGGGASDPTVLDVIGNIAGEGAYRSQMALYEGKDKARALRMRGDVARYEGEESQRAGYIGAFSSVLKGGSTLFDKYGGGRKNSVLSSTDYGGVEPYVDPSGWGMS